MKSGGTQVAEAEFREPGRPAIHQESVTREFLKHAGSIKNYLYRFFHCRHDIEDVLQDTYIRAVEAERVNHIHAPKAFLYKVAKNLALNYHSHASRKLTDYLDNLEEMDALENRSEKYLLEHQIDQEYRFVQFCKAVKRLSPQCKRAFVLNKVYGLSHREIAEQLEISPRTVEKHLEKGLLLCRDYMQRKGYQFGVNTD